MPHLYPREIPSRERLNIFFPSVLWIATWSSRPSGNCMKKSPAFRDELAKANALLISNFSTMPYDICSKTPIQKMDDFKGKRIGLIGRYFGRWVKPTGAVPVVAPMHERYTLLQSKSHGHGFPSYHPYECVQSPGGRAQFRSNQRHDRRPWDLMISLKAFNSLSPEIQKILIETGKKWRSTIPRTFCPIGRRSSGANGRPRALNSPLFPRWSGPSGRV